jgi:ATPase subunit of ABC transporter with duplicated ATPase domains
VVFAEDDYGVKSVSLTADGVPVEAGSTAPYVFSWTPSAAEIGTSVHLEATITDSSGQVTTSSVTVPVIKGLGETAAEAEAKEKADAEAKAAEEKKAGEATLKSAEDKAKAAEDKASAAEKDAAAAKAEAEKARLAAKPLPTGKVVKNTKKGTARLTVTVPTPGSLVVTGPEIKKVSGHATAPGPLEVLITPKGKALKTLAAKGKVTVTVKIAFTGPDGTKHATTTVTLVKK